MSIDTILEQVREKATADEDFRQRILQAYAGERSIVNFCRECNAAGIEVYPMDIADADEGMYAAMRRSTNGGGENSPHLGWQEEVFETFMVEIRGLGKKG